MAKIIIANMKQTPVPKNDHAIIFLSLHRFDVAKTIDETNNESVDNGPSMTKINMLIMPYDIPVW